MSFLEINNVSFEYSNNFKALDNVSLSIRRGEKVAIIGQNGAGKTTLAKLINGLFKPNKGEILINNESTINKTTAQIARTIGYVFQNPDDQIFNSDVYSEIEYGPKEIGMPEDMINEKIMEVSKLLEIDRYLKENPYNLPFSTRKLVTIASLVSMDIDAIILDEPTAGQDHNGMRILSNLINYLQSNNKTVITITHDMEFVVKNFDRVVAMANKKIIADESKRKVFWDYEVISKSNVKQPYISELAKDVGLKGSVLDIPEFIENI